MKTINNSIILNFAMLISTYDNIRSNRIKFEKIILIVTILFLSTNIS